MKRKLTFKKLGLYTALLATAFTAKLHGQAFTENFDDITLLAGNGWSLQNLSSPVGSTNWFQGSNVGAGGPFDSYNGAANSYIGANYNNTGNTGTISNWLMTPNRTFRNGDVVTFFTRKPTGTDYPDRLEVRLSTNGASTNAGASATTVGDFTTLLLSVNPSLTTGVYPTSWTMYTVTISGLPAPTSGRMAFRYYVTSAGYLGTNSDYIGIDAFTYTPYVCPGLSISPASLSGGTAGTAYSQSLSQTGALGAPSYAVTAGALPPGLTLSASGTISGTPTATGTFNFTSTVSDNSGCSGSMAYAITVVCPANPITMSLPAVCDNAGLITLTGASPAGGSYSGTGVSGGMFDPTAGTQTVTYDLTDAYGCAHSSSTTQTVNTAPVVTLSALSPACIGDADITLSNGSPAGGTYSGTNVSSGMFSPVAAGTTDVVYSYTDANGCTNSDTTAMTVNALPVVTISALSPACAGDADITLSGGAPAGGTYSGTNVSGGMFSPTTVGTTDVVYSYTDANGCVSSDTTAMTVNALPVVTMGTLSDVCQNSADVTLSGGAPAGGTYSGTNVNAGMFTPAVAGNNNIVYSYTDANGCTNSDTTAILVNAAPVVTFAPLSDVCVNSGVVTLSGGAPAGGTYSGTDVSAGMFSPNTVGTSNVVYTYTDSLGCSDSTTQTITVNACVGLQQNTAVNAVKYFPNPNTGIFTLEFTQAVKADLSVNIMDIQGKVVLKDTEAAYSGSYTHSFDLSSFAKGVYTLEIRSGNKSSYYKIAVQ